MKPYRGELDAELYKLWTTPKPTPELRPQTDADLCFSCEGTHTKHEPDCPQRKDKP